MKRLLLLCGLVALFAASSAFAGRGTITLNQTSPVYGETVTFTTSVQGHPTAVWVECYRATEPTPVYNDQVYSAEQAVGTAFVLTGWDGSSAYCFALLWQNRTILARTDFFVAGAATP